MAEQKKKRKKQPQQRDVGAPPLDAGNIVPFAPPGTFADPRATLERTMADIGKILREQEFESAEEANAYLQELLTSGAFDPGRPRRPPEEMTPLEQAQELMYEAWEAPDRRAVQLARRALEISPDCADAYVLLAERAVTVQEARGLYEQGVQAGERALGAQAFAEDAGNFWGILETRPYMRAREGLAQTLWLTGERPQAIAHCRELLRLNPDDNQGIRYQLMNFLLMAGSPADVEQLLAQYEDDSSATWLYSRALHAFLKEGSGRTSNRLLRDAMKYNPHVPQFLLGLKEPSDPSPAFMGFGDEAEATDYVSGALAMWLSYPDALAWLSEQAGKQGKRG